MKKRAYILPLMVIVLASMACSVLGGSKEPTQEVVLPSAIPTQVVEMPTEPPPTPVPPTQEPVVEQPTEEVMVVAPTEPPAPAEPQWETWVAAGDPSKEYVELAGGRMSFELPSPETYAYTDRVDAVYGDVFVEAEFETFKGGPNGIAVICRGSNRGWYELRITTINSSDRPYAGSYELYRYDYSLKQQGKNPYYNLLRNMPRINSVDIVNGYSYNTIGLICEGNQIRPFINGVEQLPNKQQVFDDVLTEGTVGVGAMSFGGGPVEIVFNSFTVEPR